MIMHYLVEEMRRDRGRIIKIGTRAYILLLSLATGWLSMRLLLLIHSRILAHLLLRKLVALVICWRHLCCLIDNLVLQLLQKELALLLDGAWAGC